MKQEAHWLKTMGNSLRQAGLNNGKTFYKS